MYSGLIYSVIVSPHLNIHLMEQQFFIENYVIGIFHNITDKSLIELREIQFENEIVVD
jgi:hypothetical protein